MALFLSTYQNKLDKKGRVSVPASFRVVLADQSFAGIIAYSSFVNPCIEACGIDRIEKLSQRIETLDPFSEERDAFAATILGGSQQLAFDGEGRIMLPELLIEQAGLSDQIVFIGKGDTFESGSRKSFKTYSARAREMARDRRGQLRSAPALQGGEAK